MDIVAFWQRVDQSGGPDACWPWTGALNDHGYGVVRIGTELKRAHRVAYQHKHGEIPPSLKIDHTCHNDSGCVGRRQDCLHRRCCNPRHHEPVTVLVNTMRGNRYKREAA